jgi:hypothetical protein
MTTVAPWKMEAQIEWLTVGPDGPLDWETYPLLKASIVFADVVRHELFSTAGMATARIYPSDDAGSENWVVEFLLPPGLAGYVEEGTQFLVVRGSSCVGVGAIADPGGPMGEG